MTGDQPVSDARLNLRELLAVLRHRKWSILAITAVTVGATLGVSLSQTPMYASTTQVLVKPINAVQALAGGGTVGSVSMNTEMEIAKSPAVAELAYEALYPATEPANTVGEGQQPGAGGTKQGSVPAAPTSPQAGTPEAEATTAPARNPDLSKQLVSQVSVRTPVESEVMEITFSDPSPLGAKRGAQAFAQAYLDFRQQQAVEAYTSASKGLLEQIEQLQPQLANKRRQFHNAKVGGSRSAQIQGEISTLLGRITLLQNQVAPLLNPQVDPGTIVADAYLPESPSSPNYLRNIELSLILGLVLGVALAFVRERLDNRLAGRSDFEAAIGAPILAVVPKVPGWRKRNRTELTSLSEPKGNPAEAYRTIRTNLQFIARDDDFQIISVTSPVLGEGKTTTVANLAVALAQGGNRVIATSCDLRKPRLHRFFNLENKVGLTSILTGKVPLQEATQRCDVKTLRVLASGPLPPNPAELLSSNEMEILLTQMRRYARFIVIDTPPVLAVSDALVLAPRSDGVVIVVDAETTTRDAAEAVRDQMAQVDANIIGGILNNLDPKRAKYYPAYYRYYYSYGYRYGDGKKATDEELAARKRHLAAAKEPDPEEMWR